MSWQLVARKDFADAARSRLLWGILAVFVVLVGVVGLTLNAASGETDAAGFLSFFAVLGGQLVVPVVALIAGYMSVVGERRSGSILVLFGLPHSRGDILAGKLVGRGAVVLVATAGAFAAAAVLNLAFAGDLPVVTFLATAGLTALLGLSFVGIAVGVSAAVATRGRAMAGAIGSYLLFGVLWEPVVAGVHYAVEGSLAGLQAPAWYFLLKRLSPVFAYTQAVNGLLEGTVTPLVRWPVEDVPQEAYAEPGALDLANRVAGDLPFFLGDWAAVLILAAWFVLPVLVGYRRFRNSDLA